MDNLSKAVYLHDGEADGAEVDGGLEGGHCLGVSQTVQTVLIHLEQQVTLLQIVSTVSTEVLSTVSSVSTVSTVSTEYS